MVELKPLDWSEPSPPDTYCHYDYCKAETPFGTLQIEWKSWKDYPGYNVDCFGNWGGSFDSLDEAKAAALNWYSARIEVSLATRPPTDEALATLQARGDRLADFVEHDSDCVLGIPGAIRSRSGLEDMTCTCGLTEALTEWRKG